MRLLVSLAKMVQYMRMGSENTKGFLSPEDVRDRLSIRPGMKTADFGCGAGEFAILIARAVGIEGLVVAIDILPTALESVSARAKALGLKNIQTIRANLEIPRGSTLPDTSQDIVLAANILIQSSKKNEIVAEAKRVLRHGGTFAAVEWKKDLPAQAGAGGFGPPEETRIAPDVLAALITAEGFSIASQFEAGAYHYGIIARKN